MYAGGTHTRGSLGLGGLLGSVSSTLDLGYDHRSNISKSASNPSIRSRHVPDLPVNSAAPSSAPQPEATLFSVSGRA